MTIEKEQLDKLNNSSETEALKELKIHQKAVKDSSPLSIIREKEVALKKTVIEMQIKADALIAEARKKAEQIKKKAAEDGEKKANEYYEKELAKIQKQAEEIKNQAPQKAQEISKIGQKNLEKAMQQLKEILLPGIS